MPVTVAYGLPSVPPPPPPIGRFLVAVANQADDTVSVMRVLPDDTVSVIDIVAVGAGPSGVAVSSDDTLIAVTNTTDGTVSIIGLPQDDLLAVIAVGAGPLTPAWSPDGTLVAVTNSGDNTVSIIEIATLSVVQTFSVGTSPQGIRFAPDGSYLAVAEGGDNTVATFDTTTWTLIARGTIGNGPTELDIASDGSYLAVAQETDDTVAIIDPAALTVTHTIPVGNQPAAVSIDPLLLFVVASNSADGTVSVIETTGWTVTDTVTVGTSPSGIDTAPDSSFIAVSNSGDNTVSIIRTFDRVVVATVAVGSDPLGLVVYAEVPPVATPTPKALKNTWRWVVCGLDGSIKSFLDKIATNVQIAYVLDDAAMMTCDVPSDHYEVYQLTNPDTLGHRYPRVNYGNRVIYGLRREEPHGKAPWVCRFAGVIDILQDQATEDDPITHVTAYDPWQWARSLPVLNIDGSLLGSGGLTYEGKTADYIARDLIANAYAWIVATFPDPMPWTEIGDGLHLPNDGEHNYIDITTGHFDTCAVIDSINFAQGMSVGEAWSQLCQTGTIDIVLRPVFGPEADKPGVLCVMNVYAQAGKERPNALFGWDLFPRNLVGVDHLLDGTQIENIGQFYAGNIAVPVAENTQSINTYGPRYVQKNYPAGSNVAAVQLLALAELALRMRGKKTLLVDPTPGLAPDPFTHYGLGDVVPVWAGRPMPPPPPLVGHGVGNALRGGIRSYALGTNRVYGFAINLSDDLQETVQNLLLSDPDESI